MAFKFLGSQSAENPNIRRFWVRQESKILNYRRRTSSDIYMLLVPYAESRKDGGSGSLFVGQIIWITCTLMRDDLSTCSHRVSSSVNELVAKCRAHGSPFLGGSVNPMKQLERVLQEIFGTTEVLSSPQNEYFSWGRINKILETFILKFTFNVMKLRRCESRS